MTKAVQDLMNAVESVRDAFHAAIYRNRDIDAARNCLSADCTFEILPGRSVAGKAAVSSFLADEMMPRLPADLEFHRVSRTGDRWRVAQEDIVTFTHDRELPWLLPGVAATSRSVEVLAISVVTVQRQAIASYRILWDHSALQTQLAR